MKSKTELEKYPESSDSAVETAESPEITEYLSNLRAYAKNPKTMVKFQKMIKEDVKTFLDCIPIFEKEPWAEDALCDAAAIKPDWAIEMSSQIADKTLREKVVATAKVILMARETLRKPLQKCK